MSEYFWDNGFFGDEEIIKELNGKLDELTGIHREFAIYRFGLDGQERHSIKKTAEHFSISTERARSLEFSVFRKIVSRMPRIPSRSRRRIEDLD